MKSLPEALGEGCSKVPEVLLRLEAEEPTALRVVLGQMIPGQREHLVRETLVHV